jgi:hypothetical protein
MSRTNDPAPQVDTDPKLPHRAAAAGEMCCLAKGGAYWGEFFAGTRITGGTFRANRSRPQGRWASGAGSWKCGRHVLADSLVALATLHRTMVMICRCLPER